MKTLLTTLAVALSATSFSYGVPDLEIANRIGYAYPGTATIDGQISDGEWDNAFKYASQPIDRTLHYNQDAMLAPASPEDLSGEYWAIWDKEGLYLLINALDDVFPPVYPERGSGAPLPHSFAVYTSTSYNRDYGWWQSPGYDFVSDMEALFAFNNGILDIEQGFFSYNQLEPIEAIIGDYLAVSGGYLVELFLPWSLLLANSEITGVSFADGIFSGGPNAETYGNERNFIGFDVHLQDIGDNKRKSRIGWSDGFDGRRGFFHWAETIVWGTLVLANPPPCTVLETVIAEPHWTLYEGDFAYGNSYGRFVYTGFCPFVYDFGSDDWWYVFEGNENPDAFYFYSYKDAAWAVFYNGVCYF